MRLADLPIITVANIRTLDPSEHFDCEIIGVVSRVHQLEVGLGYWFYLAGGDNSPLASVVSVDQLASTAVFKGTIFYESHPIVVGDSYPLITEYWNAYVYAAVLDDSRVWTKTEFKPSGSFASSIPGYTVSTNPSRPGLSRFYASSDESLDESVRVVDGGWDHEHCTICNGRVDADDPTCFVDDCGLWLCDKCHEAFAVPHDLQFVVDYPNWKAR
jgi:hypothetical protein